MNFSLSLLKKKDGEYCTDRFIETDLLYYMLF